MKPHKLFALLTVLCMLLSQSAGFAGAVGNEVTEVTPCNVTYVNPLYADVTTEEDLVSGAEVPVPLTDDPEYFMTVAEAGALLREGIEARLPVVQIHYQTDTYSSEMAKALFTSFLEAALEHTGSPTEGDYLRWQYTGFEGAMSGSSSNGTYYLTYTYTITYYSDAEQEAAVDAAVADLLASLKPSGSDYDKIRTVYDWICENVTYDYDNLENDDYELKYTAYAALIDRTAVCQGYAVLLYRLALEMGIDCRVISGTGNGGPHGWNIIKLGSSYYNADSTWDASLGGHTYFLKCPDNFPDHVRDAKYDTEEFHAAYPMGGRDYIVDSGTCGENLTWTLDSEGKLTISGTGEMEDYLYKESPWNAYRDSIFTLEILDGVTSVGGGAFLTCDNLTDAEIPGSVTSIGTCAFYCCSSLANVRMQEGLISIGGYAFHQCSSLTSVTIPNSVTQIDSGAFSGCGLTGVVIPESVTDINCVFMGCLNLANVTLPGHITGIGGSAFDTCSSLSKIDIPDSVTWIGQNAFSNCTSLTEFTVPKNVTNIYAWAFYGCSNLKEITFTGNAPIFGDVNIGVDEIFVEVTATAYYPTNDPTWTEEVRQNYGGTLTWVPVTSYTPGDINGDGKVNNRDAARLMQYLAGWDVECVTAALDVNGDGKVNNRDAARLMQYLAGWEVEIH